MRLCSGAPSDTDFPAAGQSPPDERDVEENKRLVVESYFNQHPKQNVARSLSNTLVLYFILF